MRARILLERSEGFIMRGERALPAESVVLRRGGVESASHNESAHPTRAVSARFI
jgi:hypothetical protein